MKFYRIKQTPTLTRSSITFSIVLLVLIALVPSVFAQSETPSGTPSDMPAENPLLNSEWQLVSMAGETPISNAIPTVFFGMEDTLGGNGGCNTYGGNYTVDGDTITMSDIFSTMMFCDNGFSDQETAFFEAMQAATRYEFMDGQLVITYGEGETLIFDRLVKLSNTRWRLISIAANPVIGEANPTLEFGEADAENPNQIAGNGSCNHFGGTYTLDGENISFGDLISTKMACMDADQMTQETTYFAALSTATSYVFDGQTLTLVYGENGDTLVFTRLPELIGTQWQLNTVMNQDAASAVIGAVILELNSVNGATGSGGCNTYGSTYTLDSGQISFSPIISTEMACDGDGVMEQELAYFDALQAATRYELVGDTLTIFYGDEGDGQALIFTPSAVTSTVAP